MNEKKVNKIKNYIEQCERFLKEGWAEFNKGNLTQASEKFWGASAQVVKAYAQLCGWRHDGHRFLFEVVDRLSKKTKDEELKDHFCLAGMLHTNFYEGWLTAGEVKRCYEHVQKFVEKIKKLINKKLQRMSDYHR